MPDGQILQRGGGVLPETKCHRLIGKKIIIQKMMRISTKIKLPGTQIGATGI